MYNMLWIKSFHIIFMVCWFAGLFYLPRLFVYHANCHNDPAGNERFKVMERKLYYAITIPAAILTSFFGLWLLGLHWDFYKTQGWIHLKLALVVLLWIYTLYCGCLRKQFLNDNNRHSHIWYRWFNEAPSVLLIVIVILAVVRPF